MNITALEKREIIAISGGVNERFMVTTTTITIAVFLYKAISFSDRVKTYKHCIATRKDTFFDSLYTCW